MEEHALLDKVVRTLGAAWRALRLYPTSSPMAAEAAQHVAAAVEEYVQAEPSLKLDVVREGFILRGLEGVLTAPGIPELVDALGLHGVGELHFVAPPTADEVVSLLAATQLRPHELQERNGMETVLTQEGVGAIRVVALVLNKIEIPPEIPEDEADKFLAELAADAGRLAVWLRSLLASDDEGLSEGILTLANAAGDVRVFGRTLAEAFRELDTADKDRLLEVSIDLEPVAHVTHEMLANLSSLELTAAIRGGQYGKNLSSLSYAIAVIPVGNRAPELLQEAEDALRAADTDEAQIAFLQEMIRLRLAKQPEPSLAETNPLYRSLVQATMLPAEHRQAAHADAASRPVLDLAGVSTLLYLLDTANDFGMYSRTLGALARGVPHLLEAGDFDLAIYLTKEISNRSLSSDRPWPELEAQFVHATEEACGERSMLALLAAHAGNPCATDHAKELVTLGGETAARALAAAAMHSEAEDSMDCAEAVMGKRLPELLAPQAAEADASNAGRLAEMFARDGGPWCIQALGQLVARPEDKIRAETARGIANVGGQAMSTYMPRLLRDEASSVAMIAARALMRNEGPGAVEMLGRRLAELESEKDLTVTREIISLLGKSASPAAERILEEVADSGSFLRKGKHSDRRRLAREALDSRTREGGR